MSEKGKPRTKNKTTITSKGTTASNGERVPRNSGNAEQP